jgi:hypothetical protein
MRSGMRKEARGERDAATSLPSMTCTTVRTEDKWKVVIK